METTPATRDDRGLAIHIGHPSSPVIPMVQNLATYGRKGLPATLMALLLISFASIARAQNADLSVNKKGPSSVAAGENITYTVMVANATGPQASVGPNTLIDALPPGTTFVSATPDTGWACSAPAPGGGGSIVCTDPDPISVGQSFNFTFIIHLGSSITPGAMITNVATVSHAGSDPDPTNNASSVTTMVIPASFDTCLKDNTTGNLLQWNSVNGQYLFTRCSDGFILAGTGLAKLVNGIKTLTDFKADRRISAGFNTGQLTGNATIYLMVAQGVWQTFQIVDTNPAAVCACN
jgi:uncharacterized repeat protein (TIGR01451 family)